MCALGLASTVTVRGAEDEDSATERAPMDNGSYGWVELGANQMMESSARLSGAVGGLPFSTDLDLDYNVGFAAAGGFGDWVTPWLAGEAQGGFLQSGIRSANSSTLGDYPLSGTIYSIPIFANAQFRVPNLGKFSPFAGGGIGAWISWADAQGTVDVPNLGAVNFETDSTTVSFGYQAFAGLRYRLHRNAHLALTYRLQGTQSPSWDLIDRSNGQSIGDLKADSLLDHSITLGFVMKIF
jgi:opacity protein-like surface antigen